jgi:hypothetical protein
MAPDPTNDSEHETKVTEAKEICWRLLRGGIEARSSIDSKQR